MRDMTRELLIRASRPLHMTRAYQTPRFDPRILRSPIFPREFTPMGVDPDPYLPLSIFFFFPFSRFARWMERKRKNYRQIDRSDWAPDLEAYLCLQRAIKFLEAVSREQRR